ncbi:MAG: hypothetical protein AABO41_10315 [Acidobacteriota bacterium]
MNNKRMAAVRIARVSVAFAAVVSLLGFGSYAPKADSFNMSFVELAGVNGGQNNVVFAFDRYVLVAPYAPKGVVTEDGNLSQLDNHFLYIIDAKKPGIVLSKDLTAFASSDSPRTIYYPTKLTFDPATQIVFVRGTRFEERDGEIEAIEVVAYLRVNLGDNGKPVIDSTVTSFDIQGVGGEPHSAYAPTDIALSAKGNHLVFTNGASIFTYSLDQGYLYKVDLVHPSEYGVDNSIAYLAINRDSNILSVYSNKKTIGEDNVGHDQSEISFYKVVDDGTLTLLKRAYPKDLPEAAALTPGSNVAVYSEPDKPDVQYAVFVTNDGSLCQIDLHTEGLAANVRQMAVFPELAQQSSDDTSARLVTYDASKRVVGIVSQGYSARIARPVNARIARPVNVNLGQPVLAVAKFSKRGKVVSRNVFADEFVDQGGLSQLVSLPDSNEWLMATYTGKLFSTSTTGDFEDSSPQLLGEIAPRTERIDYLASRGSLVAVQSCASSDDGLELLEPGSVAVGKFASANRKSPLVGAAQMIFPTASAAVTRGPAIRRPCNIKR